MKYRIENCNILTPGSIDNAPPAEQLAKTKIDRTNVTIAVNVQQVMS